MRFALTYGSGEILKGLVLALALLLWGMGAARAKGTCTLILETVSGKVLVEQGACKRRMTPASTFKLPLAVLGFEHGLLQDGETPVLSYQPGDPDWGGANWRRDTAPRDWQRYSVVWYSQRLTRALGTETLTDGLRQLGFGNADVSGDAGQGKGLETAWLSSSLKISPQEQARFLRGLRLGTLPVSEPAMTKTREITQMRRVAGWRMWGKTGGAFPRRADGTLDRGHGIGWYVGWAEKADQSLIFVRLTQGVSAKGTSPGIVTRKGVWDDWARLVRELGF